MAGPPPINTLDVIQIRILGSVVGRKTQLVTNWSCFNPDSSTTYVGSIAQVYGGFITSGFFTNYLACLPSNWAATQISVQRTATPPLNQYPPLRSVAGITANTSAGTYAGTTSQSASVAEIQRTSLFAGKTQHGALRIGPSPDAGIVLDKFTTAYLAILATFANSAVSQFVYNTTGILVPILFRRGTKATPHVPSFTQVLSYSVGPYYSTQERRRFTGFGGNPGRRPKP